MLIITGRAVIPESNRKSFLEIGKTQVSHSLRETGCISYSFHEDAMSPGSFFFFEEWADRAAVDFHFAQPYCIEFIGKARELASTPPEIRVYDATPARR